MSGLLGTVLYRLTLVDLAYLKMGTFVCILVLGLRYSCYIGSISEIISLALLELL